jgi:hypothetical protein
MDKRQFWATKSPLAEYHAVEFDHPSFESPIRIVANQFAPVTLAGEEHMPAPMTIKPPEQSADARVRLQIGFPRAKVGQEFKLRLRQVTDAGLQDPISVTYSVYLGTTDAPQLTWELYVSDANGVAFGREAVQVTATDDNPMRRAVAPIYDPADFTGLEIL